MNRNTRGRELLAAAALKEIPKLLTLQDRNRHSPTYGCFDRNYWHYKVIDFPSGMAQEFVWPLALACTLDLPSNPYVGNEAVREYVRAGILFAARSGHRDGSCDDYFPHEHALGATAFSLLACAESYRLVEMQSDEARQFLERRASWLARRQESGRLSNHHALVALGLDVVGRTLKTGKFETARDARITELLSWQTDEGWFPEYAGFDPGYDTLTLSCLAELHCLHPEERLEKAIRDSVALLAEFVHPDGSFGGEYTNRNTYNFFPHGFELAGRWHPEALSVNDYFLYSLGKNRAPCYSDDRIIGHHVWNYLLAARDYVERDAPSSRGSARRQSVALPRARLVIDRRAGVELYLSFGKGGAFKLFRDNELALSDTGISLRTRDGKTAVTHLADDYEHKIEHDRIVIGGAMGWAKQTQISPLRLIVFRILNLSLGRIAPDLLRSLLQTMLITGKHFAPFRFERELRWIGTQWTITDRIEAKSWNEVESAMIGPDQTSIYVAMSRTFQQGQLQPWLDLTPQVRALKEGEPLVAERTL
jgi:hypothetical protein